MEETKLIIQVDAEGNLVGMPISEDDFVARFPETSFARPVPAEVLEGFGHAHYIPMERPLIDGRPSISPASPVYDPRARAWRQQWSPFPEPPKLVPRDDPERLAALATLKHITENTGETPE